MKINIKAVGIELTPAISDYLDKKLEAVKKFVDESRGEAVCMTEIGKTTRHHKSGEVFRAEAKIMAGGEEFFAWSEKDDLYAAIDKLKDEIISEITSSKQKEITDRKKGGEEAKKMLKETE